MIRRKFRKGLTLSIILLFYFTAIIPCINVNVQSIDNKFSDLITDDEKDIKYVDSKTENSKNTIFSELNESTDVFKKNEQNDKDLAFNDIRIPELHIRNDQDDTNYDLDLQ